MLAGMHEIRLWLPSPTNMLAGMVLIMAKDTPTPSSDTVKAFDALRAVMRRLRSPDGGCAWDIEQDFASIAPYTIEEAYEVADAIERGNMYELREELGDLLFQVMFHSQMAEEAGHFDIDDVTCTITDKMIRRHPHVFEAPDDRSAEEQTVAWEQTKAAERAAKGLENTSVSALDGVALALPALLRAGKLTKRAARTGFDWARPEPVFDKLEEEVQELRDALASGDKENIAEEMGDLLIVCANLARCIGIEPETALRRANTKFERRFRAMEALARAKGQDFEALSLDQQEALWTAVKNDE